MQIKLFETQEMVTKSVFFFFPLHGRHFPMGCQKLGLSTQSVNINSYKKTVDRLSIFQSILLAYWILLIAK
jgi:hypothetical protein